MGRIRIDDGDNSIVLPLAATTVLGRHPTCTWVLPQPEIPTFWVELRHIAAGWTWRELGGDARGPRRRSAGLGPDWWLLEPGQRLNGRSVHVELLDDGPPSRFVVDLSSGAAITGQALEQLVAEDTGRPRPAGWELEADPSPALEDGAQFTLAGRRYRFHEGRAPQATAQRQLDLLRHSTRIELRVEDGRPLLLIWDGPVERKARGAPLWSLVPYLEARLADIPKGGWLNADEAHERWRELCPSSPSGPERMGQDRSRTCRAMRTLGVVNPHTLFHRRRVDDRWQVRVALDPTRINLQLTIAD
jgi:hypothetical protein